MNKFEQAGQYVWENLYCDKTGLIYDARSSTNADGAVRHLPTPEEIKCQIPNPCGWGTGMEDSVLNNGSMLEALLAKQAVTGEDLSREAGNLMRGLLLCANVSHSPGFLARSVHPADGCSHYINSSRDQYTHWVYAGWKYFHSPLCTDSQKEAIRQALASFALRAEREIIPENGYCYLRTDGKPAVVSQMWGDIGAHEYLRLPMIYAAAWDVTQEERFLALYRGIREEALEKSFALQPSYPMAYALLQMQYSVRLLYDLFGDRDYGNLMNEVADRVMGFASKATLSAFDHPYANWRSRPAIYLFGSPQGGYAYYVPQHTECYEKAFFPVRHVSEALIVQALCPDRAIPDSQIETLWNIAGALELSRHSTYAPVLLFDAYWMLRSRGYLSEKLF